MLALAGKRAKDLGLKIGLIEGDAERLPFPDDRSTPSCVHTPCAASPTMPEPSRDAARAQAGGRLILVDHIRSSVQPILWLQWLYEFIPRRTKGEYATRRPAVHVMAGDFRIEARDRLRAGIIERLVAVKTVA